MTSISRLALSALIVGGSAAGLGSAAEAQRAPRQGVNTPAVPTVRFGDRTLNLSAQERTALAALDAAVRGTDRAAQDAALAAAQAAARGADARYALARYQFQIGRQRQDAAMQSAALDILIASPGVTPEDLATFVGGRAAIAFNARDYRTAQAMLTRLSELRPNDPAVLADLAETHMAQSNVAAALPIFQRALAAREASGQPAPESWYRRAFAAAANARVQPQAFALGRSLVSAYPSAQNWRDVIQTYRQLSGLDNQGLLDVLRLARASGSLSGERDYQAMAEFLNQNTMFGEAKAVLDEGVSRRMVDPNKPAFRSLIALVNRRAAEDRATLAASQRQALAGSGTAALRTADALVGYGQYADAITLYRSALQKGGVDANVVNTRLGMALALSGQRAAAEAAFRLVTGQRAGLAELWLTWLARRPA